MSKAQKKQQPRRGEIIIYKPKKGDIELKVKMEKESVWLDAHQMAQLFGVNRPAIVKHVNNVYNTGELDAESTCSVLEQVARDGKIRTMNLYNLDMVISVGYRINSKQATQFRIWATKILKSYLTKGYAINNAILKEEKEKLANLRDVINFLHKKAGKKQLAGQEKEILNLLDSYSKSLTLLEKYDKSLLKVSGGAKPKFILTYSNCAVVIQSIKRDLIAKKEASNIFGIEREPAFKAIVDNLYQTYSQKELYKTIEEKAANLLYLTIKDHPFSDGNKRIGSFMFVYFLDMNKYLHNGNGEEKISNNTLATLALLIAESAPKEKEQLISLIIQLIK